MSCWCEEMGHLCADCEYKADFRRLSPENKALILTYHKILEKYEYDKSVSKKLANLFIELVKRGLEDF